MTTFELRRVIHVRWLVYIKRRRPRPNLHAIKARVKTRCLRVESDMEWRYYPEMLDERKSEAHARELFAKLYPELTVRETSSKLLAEAILVAHAEGPASWSVSAFDDAIRLNVGPVEVLFLASSEIFAVLDPESLPAHIPLVLREHLLRDEVSYPSVPGAKLICRIPAELVASVYKPMLEGLRGYVGRAARRRRRTTWSGSHSSGVVEFLTTELRTTIPSPEYGDSQDAKSVLLPDELSSDVLYREGSMQRVLVNAYERNAEARDACIRHYGTACVVCGFRFGEAYGKFAEGFIHVHHIKPLSEIREEYEVDPIRDLRPLCANCHAAIHIGGECRDVHELRESLGKIRRSPASH